ncbi:MAG TPA: hypothetical protein VGM67_15485 [Gemmatimonadaceae bacterium]|jgi:signal transduction histidine kinase
MSRAAESVGSSVVDTLWLATLQRIVGRVSHEVKGALNGVSVNLEVVRSRSAKSDTLASAVSSFANAAVDQLDGLITMTEALLSVSREIREPVELGLLFRRIGALLAPASRVDGCEISFDASMADVGETSANGAAVRLTVASVLLAAIEQSHAVRCVAGLVDDGGVVTVRIDGGHDAANGVSVDAEIVTAAADAGIVIMAESSAILISFPR